MTVIVTLRDMRACKICSPGAREFCKRHNINWTKFITEGIPEEVLIATGDAMAMKMVEAARGRGR